MRDLTLKQLTAVPVLRVESLLGACLLHSGAPRSEPHADRKLSAAEAIETKEFPEILDVDKSLSGQQSAKCAGKPCYQH